MTAMINQEALAKAQAVAISYAVAVAADVDGGDKQVIGRAVELAITAYIEALPHVYRAGVLEEAAKVVDTHRPDASFDDSSAGYMERDALLKNVASAIRSLAQPAVNTSPEGVGGWQPIENAPKDGTLVILWAAAWEMSWGIQLGHFEGDGEGGGEWVTGEGTVDDNDPDFDPDAEVDIDAFDPEDDANMGPTHWQSLPAIPSPTDERSK